VRSSFSSRAARDRSMPQLHLPMFPNGVTHITNELAFEKKDGKITYFNGHMPVFFHDEDDIASFRMITGMMRDELALENDAPLWILPKARSKSNRDVARPLPPLARSPASTIGIAIYRRCDTRWSAWNAISWRWWRESSALRTWFFCTVASDDEAGGLLSSRMKLDATRWSIARRLRLIESRNSNAPSASCAR
jgi:hypothetical protein